MTMTSPNSDRSCVQSAPTNDNEPRRLFLPSLSRNPRTRRPTAASDDSCHSVSSKSEPVLRYGETVDSLFCWDIRAGSDGRSWHWRSLCEQVCAERCNDAAAWREVLLHTMERVGLDRGDHGKRLIHLLRRATSRFKISAEMKSSDKDDVLKIWLLYAILLLIYDSTNRSKETYKHIQRHHCANDAETFSSALFDRSEGMPDESLEEGLFRLKRSLDGGVSVLEVVGGQFRRLECCGLLQTEVGSSLCSVTLQASMEGPSFEPMNKSVPDQIGSSHLPPASGTEVSPATVSKEESTSHHPRTRIQSTPDAEGFKSYRAKLESRKRLRADRALRPRSSKEVGSIAAILSQSIHDGAESDESDRETVPNSKTREQVGDNWPEGVILASAPDSAQVKKHFHDNISPIDEDGTSSVKDLDLGYLLNWDPAKRETKRVTIVEDRAREKESTKITRSDLGYMMNWEPFPKQHDGRFQSNMSKIEEEATEASMTVGCEKMTAETNSSDEHRSENSGKRQRTWMETNVSTGSNGDDPSKIPNEKSNSHDLMSNSSVDCSFLPLIEKNNIITVDNEPYAKLGIIGKGGSCKVYRALSRGCDVVALKKVKLDGLNKATIDGYANEIALLKRLQGNPAIIQLFSSEVDLERKSIFLVMELGEVDLNYVLRQQELMSSKHGGGTGRSALNMNFIRLTWQQMLSAVHSIHQERIVHSDLKPANFLFVRGALKLIDFGIAKAIESQDTTNVYRETLSGTLSYMSPEAIMDTSTNSKGVRVNKCGRASDIWSLGCILYQMVYGKTPFADCQGIPQKVLAITNVNHEIEFPDDVDEAAIDAMKLCLERNPRLRGTIDGPNGLLSEHVFLHSRTKRARK